MRLQYSAEHRTIGNMTINFRFIAIALSTLLSLAANADSAAQADCPNPLRTIPIDNNACANEWLSQLINRVGCTLVDVELHVSGARRHRLFLDGQAEILIGMSRTPLREQLVHFSVPIAEHRLLLLARSNSLVPEDMRWCDNTMKQLSVILPGNGAYGKKVDFLRQENECVRSTQTASLGPEQSFKMLLANRADLMVTPESWYKNLHDDEKRLLKKLDLILWRDQSALAMRGLDASFMKRVNDEIKNQLAAGNTPCNLSLPQP